jgi:hypothetical protein
MSDRTTSLEAAALRPEQFRASDALRDDLRGVGGKALVVGVVGAVATAAGAFLDQEHFHSSYLAGWLLWYTVASGCLGLLLLHHLSGGKWGIVLRRPMEAAARTIPFLALLALPLLFGLDKIFVWTDRAKVEADHLLHHKAPYLNSTAFVVRFVVIMAIFSLYAFLLSRKSAEQDAEGDGGRAYRMQQVSSVGLLLFIVFTSFVGFDWVMSLDPYWFSSLYGAIFLSGSAIAALTFLILVANFLVKREPMAAIYHQKRFHDFGTLLFAFVMFFTYLTLSQFIISYQGNLPEEVVWFHDRFEGWWGYVAFGLLGLHFFFPFFVLLHRAVKKRAAVLSAMAAFLLLMRYVDLIWQSRPSLFEYSKEGLALSWLDLAAPVGIGGLFVFLFVRELAKRPLLPAHDPSLPEALGHE